MVEFIWSVLPYDLRAFRTQFNSTIIGLNIQKVIYSPWSDPRPLDRLSALGNLRQLFLTHPAGLKFGYRPTY